jgi:hypothetical protein
VPISSDEKQLSISEIMVYALQEQDMPKDMLAPSMAALVQEGAMPDTDVRNYGNTVFITHFKTKDGVKAVFSRGLNADTARNYLSNGEEYFKYLMGEKVDYFVTFFEDARLKTIFRYIERPEVQARVGGTATVELLEDDGLFGATVKLEAKK